MLKKESRGWNDPPLSLDKVALNEVDLSNRNTSLFKKISSLSSESYAESYKRLYALKEKLQNQNESQGQKIEIVGLDDNHKLVLEELTGGLSQ